MNADCCIRNYFAQRAAPTRISAGAGAATGSAGAGKPSKYESLCDRERGRRHQSDGIDPRRAKPPSNRRSAYMPGGAKLFQLAVSVHPRTCEGSRPRESPGNPGILRSQLVAVRPPIRVLPGFPGFPHSMVDVLLGFHSKRARALARDPLIGLRRRHPELRALLIALSALRAREIAGVDPLLQAVPDQRIGGP
jgi:hypothetical protein